MKDSRNQRQTGGGDREGRGEWNETRLACVAPYLWILMGMLRMSCVCVRPPQPLPPLRLRMKCAVRERLSASVEDDLISDVSQATFTFIHGPQRVKRAACGDFDFPRAPTRG